MHTYSGGCHCGAVRFEVDVLEQVALRCNCSICRMKGFLHVIVPRAQFRLLRGEQALTTYRFNTGVAQHTFCSTCGMHPFYVPRSHPEGMDVNLNCLDHDLSTTFEVRPFDGRNWEENIDGIR